jgi:hypothetical protein
MAAITTIHEPDRQTGTTIARTTADATNTVVNDGKTRLLVKNNGAGPHVLTITTYLTADADAGGLAVADLEITVAAGDEIFLGPFPTNIYNANLNDPTSTIEIAVDGTASEVELVAIK